MKKLFWLFAFLCFTVSLSAQQFKGSQSTGNTLPGAHPVNFVLKPSGLYASPACPTDIMAIFTEVNGTFKWTGLLCMTKIYEFAEVHEKDVFVKAYRFDPQVSLFVPVDTWQFHVY